MATRQLLLAGVLFHLLLRHGGPLLTAFRTPPGSHGAPQGESAEPDDARAGPVRFPRARSKPPFQPPKTPTSMPLPGQLQ